MCKMPRRPLSQAHKDKIAAGMRAYHKKCRSGGAKSQKTKVKAKAKSKQLTPVQLLQQLKAAGQDTSGQAAVNRMNSAVGKMERRAAVRRDAALARRIRNIEFRWEYGEQNWLWKLLKDLVIIIYVE